MPEQEKEIEILRAGAHEDSKGIKVALTPSDLQEIADSYDPSHFRAPLIVSHDNRGKTDRALADSEFAYGAPKQLRVVGDRLKAVFDRVAPQFVDWVKNGNLLSVSSSVYLRNSPNNPKPGKLSLRHIAALGKSPPAIKGMSPLTLSEWEWDFSEENEDTIAEFEAETAVDTTGGILLITEQDKKRMDEIEQKEAALKEREAAIAAAEAKLRQTETELRKKEYTSFCESVIDRVTPAIASGEEVVAFMQFVSGDREEVEFSEDTKQAPIEWFKEFVKRLPPQVEFGERVRTAPVNSTETEAAAIDKRVKAAYENAWKQGLEN